MLLIIDKLLVILRTMRSLTKVQRIMWSFGVMSLAILTTAGIWALSVTGSPTTTNSAAKVATTPDQKNTSGDTPVLDNSLELQPTPNPSSNATPPEAEADGYDIILSTTTITKTPDQRSSLVTARTSDGRKVAWAFDMGRSGLTTTTDIGQSSKPAASVSFWLEGTLANDAATIQVIAYTPSATTASVKYIHKSVTITSLNASTPTLSILFDDETHLSYDSGEPIRTARFSVTRLDGYTGALSATATLSNCPDSVYALPVTFSGDYGSIATKSSTPIAELTECTVHVTVAGGDYTASSSGTLTYDPKDN